MKRKFLTLLAAASLGVLPLGTILAQNESVLVEEAADFDTSDMIMEEPSQAPAAIVLDDVQVPEGAQIEFSVTELQMLISSGGAAVLREYQEDPSNQRVIFSNAEEARRILGESPRIIYFPEGPDPMIIPWIRDRVVAEELFQESIVARTNRDFDRARTLLREIQEKYPNSPEAVKAPGEIAAIDKTIADELARQRDLAGGTPVEVVAPAPDPQQVVLPAWVKNNTNGVMLRSDGMHRVVVSNDFLRVGESVPRYAMVTVKEITESEVVYLYENREFKVDVDGAF